MARQLRIEFPGAFYHVMNRGNAGEHVLPADEDKQTFIDCLHRANRRFAIPSGFGNLVKLETGAGQLFPSLKSVSKMLPLTIC